MLAILIGPPPALPAGSAAEPPAVKLKEETSSAFEHYVRLTEARNVEELKRGSGLLRRVSVP